MMREIGWTLRALLGHWRRHKLQAATAFLGLALATALWSGVQALNDQARQSYARAADVLTGGNLPTLRARDGHPFSEQLFVALRRGGWVVSPLLEGQITLDDRALRLLGIEPVTLIGIGGGSVDASTSAFAPEFVMPPGQALAAPDTIRRLGLSPDDRPALASGTRLPPIATAPDLPPGTILVDIGVAQRLLGQEGLISSLMVGAELSGRTPLAAIAGNRLELVPAEAGSELGELTDSFHLNLTAFSLLSFCVGLFIVYAAVALAFEQRRPTMRSMRAAGVSPRALTIALLVELLSLALVAGLAGVALGYAVAAALLPDVAATLRGLYGATVSGALTLDAAWWLGGIAMSTGGAAVAAVASIAKLRRLPVLDTARPEAWMTAQRRRHRYQAALALALLAGAAAVAAFGSGLVAGFVVMGGFLLGAALGLPVILGLGLAAAERRSKRPLALWFWADSRQQLSGLSLALMALLLALAANIGVGSMVGGFRLTFTEWLNQRLAAELYILASTPREAADLERFLENRPDVRAILPSQEAGSRLGGQPVRVVGYTDHGTYRDHWRLLAAGDMPWDTVETGTAALVNEQLARRLDLRPGDPLRLPTPDGDWPLTVAGIYADYGNPRGELRVTLPAFRQYWPDVAETDLSLRLAPAAVPALSDDLRRRFDLTGNRIIDQTSLKRLSMQLFERTFTVTAALNTLTLLVAGVALLTSLLTLSGMRITHLAPLWAMGVTRGRLVLLEFGKVLALAALTALFAMPLGVLVAWCLVDIINVEAFGWRLPLHVFPGAWAGLFGLAVLTAGIAALLPATALWRQPPAQLIRVFADER